MACVNVSAGVMLQGFFVVGGFVAGGFCRGGYVAHVIRPIASAKQPCQIAQIDSKHWTVRSADVNEH